MGKKWQFFFLFSFLLSWSVFFLFCRWSAERLPIGELIRKMSTEKQRGRCKEEWHWQLFERQAMKVEGEARRPTWVLLMAAVNGRWRFSSSPYLQREGGGRRRRRVTCALTTFKHRKKKKKRDGQAQKSGTAIPFPSVRPEAPPPSSQRATLFFFQRKRQSNNPSTRHTKQKKEEKDKKKIRASVAAASPSCLTRWPSFYDYDDISRAKGQRQSSWRLNLIPISFPLRHLWVGRGDLEEEVRGWTASSLP